MRAFRSIRWRLQFWYALLLALVLAGFGLSAYEIQRTEVTRSTDAELERRVGNLARLLRPPPPVAGRPRRPPEDAPGAAEGDELPGDDLDGPPEPGRPRDPDAPVRRENLALGLLPEELADYSTDGPGKWYYVIWLRNGPALTRSAHSPADVPRPERRSPRDGPAVRVRGPLREGYLALGPGDFVVVGHDITADLAGLHRFGWLMAGVAGLVLILGLVGGHWLVGRSLRPIAEISAAASLVAAGRLDQRIATSDTESELGELAAVLDATFARLEAAFVRQARFTADAAHELRTPLAVMLMHTQNALAVTCGAEEHAEALAACQRAAQRMRALTEALLRLARLDSGAQPLSRVPLDLAARAAEGIELVRPLADRRGITIRAELPPAPCTGDPEQIDQVITNLLTNAIEHNREHGEVMISTRMTPGGASLTVADRGPGIAADHLPHVFERFYRADASRSRASGGVGLGLAIARAIVEAHGGTLTVASHPGQGAAFTMTLPSEKLGDRTAAV